MNTIPAKEETDSLLDQLAFILSTNVVTNSFSVGAEQAPLSAMLKETKTNVPGRYRNILVLGAGASHNVNKSIPLAPAAVLKVEDAIVQKYGAGIKKYQSKLVDELTKVYKLRSTDFETQLLAYSDIDNGIVIRQLEKEYGMQYPVSLFYEIVAHLFKHRFLDVIINFNFDEMLDSAIEEEMQDSQYKRIYSDGDCYDPDDMEKLLYGNRLVFPVYIKPHGTISHPSTLRFTRKAYYDTPSKITDTIIYLIKGETGYKDPKKSKLPVNLIVAGFGMQSHEFNSILSEYLEPGRASLYYFDLYNDKVNYWDRFKEENITSFLPANSHLFPIGHEAYDNRTLDDWFYLLWTKIKDVFHTTYQPKGIARHIIVHEVFNPMADDLLKGTYTKAEYFRDRTVLELGLEILASNDGLINLRQLKESRVQKYYSLYKREKHSDLELFVLMRKYGLSKYKGYIKDSWYFDPAHKSDTELLIKVFSGLITPKLLDNFINIRDNARLLESIRKMSESKLFLNLKFSARDNYISIFQNVTMNDVMTTDIKWTYMFQRYFSPAQRSGWNLILSITETGGIFTTPGVGEHLDGKNLMLICSYHAARTQPSAVSYKQMTRTQLLDKKLKTIKRYIMNNNGTLELRMLPFRNHNQHVVLFSYVNPETRQMELKGGFYYGRRNMSKRVTPIHIHDRDNLHELLCVFLNYWERAYLEDNMDLIKEAVLNGNVTESTRSLAGVARNKTFDELRTSLISAFLDSGN